LFTSLANSVARRWMPEFFPAAVRRVRWHALHGEKIALVTGTLAPLAEIVKTALERELLLSGVDAAIYSIATQLESSSGRCTGRVLGVPMFGEEKGRAIQQFSRSHKTPLAQCTAYGDHAMDRWMLAAVGHPTAVNPSRAMFRVARLYRWKIENWTSCPVRSTHIRHLLKWKGEVER
jgi:phosphoserine phosphatase